MDYITTIEMSKIWGISSRRISLLCSQGRVPGAEKKGCLLYTSDAADEL